MSIAEIMSEIDAHLLRLRNARDLLLTPMRGARRKSKPRRKRTVVADKTGRPLSIKPRILNDESRFDRMVALVTTPKQRLDSPSQVCDSVAPKAAVPRELPVAVTVQRAQQDVRIERLPAPDRQIPSTRIGRRPVTKPAFGTTLENSKPAIALAGPVDSKIGVVSAEQAQRERERAAQSAVQRPRVPAIGLTGKAAFEALFNDGRDTSKTTRD
jgi:hypothetical protein